MKRLTLLTAMLTTVLVAAPAAAQSAAGDQYEDPSAETGTIRGVLTEVGGGSVVVDGNPSGPPCTGGAEAILALSDDTEVLLRQGGETAPASVEDLRVGQTVEATYAVPGGPRPAICPPTYEAIRIVIFAASGDPTPPVPGPDDDQYGDENPPAPGPGVPSPVGGSGVLPDTGGALLPALGAGLLLIACGLLARRIVR